MQKQKIGIMGGAFNPIHYGHLLLGERAREQFGLDKVLYMPLKKPPHKDLNEMASDVHRMKMIQLAIGDNPYFELSTLELERVGTTYTVDTVNYLTSHYPEKEYYFIIGADSLFQFETWRNPGEILRLVHILAATRNGILALEMEEQAKYLEKKYHGAVDLIRFLTMDISSSSIRKRCGSEKSIKYLVPAEVEKYILDNNLYIISEDNADGTVFMKQLSIHTGLNSR